METDLILFTGNANPALAERMTQYLDMPLGKATVSSFADGETRVELQTNVRGASVYILQPTCSPSNHNIMEALIIADACKRASAKEITPVMPYFWLCKTRKKKCSKNSNYSKACCRPN